VDAGQVEDVEVERLVKQRGARRALFGWVERYIAEAVEVHR
jgi:hypothetical protein